MTDKWLETLTTEDAQSGYDLAIKLSRIAVKKTQPDADTREKLRTKYESDFGALIDVSKAVALNFQTVAAANDYWRSR